MVLRSATQHVYNGGSGGICDPRALGGRGVRRALRSSDLPPPPRGRLRLTQAQLEALEDAARERSCRKIAAYLRQVAPEEASGLSDAQLRQHVLHSAAEGQAAGLQSECSQGQWAYLALTTGGAFGRNGKLLGYVMHGGGVPDTNLDRMFERMTKFAQADAAAGHGR